PAGRPPALAGRHRARRRRLRPAGPGAGVRPALAGRPDRGDGLAVRAPGRGEIFTATAGGGLARLRARGRRGSRGPRGPPPRAPPVPCPPPGPASCPPP